jgi:hypothetical protein
MTVHSRQAFLDYGGFVEKFKPKKTTDDCETPDAVYGAVCAWAIGEYSLAGREVVRPFWPGGDYERFDYPDDCVVIDNPPFSIVTPIVRWYEAHHVDYFLFAPHLTLFSINPTSHIAVGADIVYANNAVVRTSFVTSLDAFAVRTAPTLYQAIIAAQPKPERTSKLKRYVWPDEVLRSTELDPLVRAGIEFGARREECLSVSRLDGVDIFGGGCLLATNAAAAKAAAKAAAEAAAEAAIVVRLSEREKAALRYLDSASEVSA